MVAPCQKNVMGKSFYFVFKFKRVFHIKFNKEMYHFNQKENVFFLFIKPLKFHCWAKAFGYRCHLAIEKLHHLFQNFAHVLLLPP